MHVLDTRQSVRLAILMEMLEEVSRATEPEEAARAYTTRIGRIRPVDAVVALSVRDLPEGHYKITRRALADGPEGQLRHELHDPWKNWESLPMLTGGFLGGIIAAPEPRLLHGIELGEDGVLGPSLGDMRSCMALPLMDGGRVLNWTFQFRRDPRGFTVEELEQNLLTANLFGAMTRNLVSLEQIRTLNARLHAQFEEVARVQQSLLPERAPAVPGLTFATSYLTSEQAGGDYYDFFELDGDGGGGRLGILVADVSGHGPGAATVMAMLHAILHSYPDLALGPAAALRYANERLVSGRSEGGEGSFVTALLAVYDPATRGLRIARAGHPPPRVFDARTGAVTGIDGPSAIPLGILGEYEVREHALTLRPGQTVVFYTDGITEAFNDAREMFGVAGLDRAIAASSGAPDGVVDAVHGALFRFNGRRTRDDDQTLVVLRVEQESSG